MDKKETRSNWIRRPLSDAQLKYAALDVEYLIHLYKNKKKNF
jgi:ribonuclease D